MVKTVKWDITWRCNLRCKHCGAIPYLEKVTGKEKLSTETIERILLDIKNNYFDEVDFLGGEPLLRNDFIQILKYTEEIGLDTSFSTNGTLLTKKVARQLAQITTLRNIAISVYGGLKETHSMIVGKNSESGVYKALSNIRKELNRKTKLSLNIVVTKYLIQEKARYIASLADFYDTDVIYLLPLSKLGNANTHWEELKIESKDLINYTIDLINNLIDINKKRRIASKNEIKLSLGTITPKLSLYILKNYGPLSFLVINKLNFVCPVIENKRIYLTPEGYVYPCDPFHTFIKEIERELKKKIEPLTAAKVAIKDIIKSEYLNLLRDYFIELKLKDIREECKLCEFASACNSCPIILKYTQTPIYCGEHYG